MKTYKRLFSCFLVACAVGITGCWPVYDVVIYGATPAGIAAALSAADSGAEDVVLLEPTYQIGGKIKSFPHKRSNMYSNLFSTVRLLLSPTVQ